MKKLFCIMFIAVLLSIFSGCSDETPDISSSSSPQSIHVLPGQNVPTSTNEASIPERLTKPESYETYIQQATEDQKKEIQRIESNMGLSPPMDVRICEDAVQQKDIKTQQGNQKLHYLYSSQSEQIMEAHNPENLNVTIIQDTYVDEHQNQYSFDLYSGRFVLYCCYNAFYPEKLFISDAKLSEKQMVDKLSDFFEGYYDLSNCNIDFTSTENDIVYMRLQSNEDVISATCAQDGTPLSFQIFYADTVSPTDTQMQQAQKRVENYVQSDFPNATITEVHLNQCNYINGIDTISFDVTLQDINSGVFVETYIVQL